ncbi:MAG: hypothetical protein MK364_24830, partial [Pirellulales bacterium]|nr:hypothetical protein [Pirellulales bacterium]
MSFAMDRAKTGDPRYLVLAGTISARILDAGLVRASHCIAWRHVPVAIPSDQPFSLSIWARMNPLRLLWSYWKQ